MSPMVVVRADREKSATKKRGKPAKKRHVFKTVYVAIYRNGKRASVQALPDHRAAWCKRFNAEWASLGITAQFLARKPKGGGK
jgi:hypothetical protein